MTISALLLMLWLATWGRAAVCDAMIRTSQRPWANRARLVKIAHGIDPANDICSVMHISELIVAKKRALATEEACVLSKRYSGDACAALVALICGVAFRNSGAIVMARGAFEACLRFDPKNEQAKARLNALLQRD